MGRAVDGLGRGERLGAVDADDQLLARELCEEAGDGGRCGGAGCAVQLGGLRHDLVDRQTALGRGPDLGRDAVEAVVGPCVEIDDDHLAVECLMNHRWAVHLEPGVRQNALLLDLGRAENLHRNVVARDGRVARMLARGGCWPTEDQILLLRAALLDADTARTAWERWRAGNALETADSASLRLFPLVYSNLRSAGLDELDLAKLKGAYRGAWVRNQLLFKRAAEALGALG